MNNQRFLAVVAKAAALPAVHCFSSCLDTSDERGGFWKSNILSTLISFYIILCYLQTATTALRRRLSPLFLASWLSVFSFFGSSENHDTLHENATGFLVFGFRSLPICWACLDGLSFMRVCFDMMKESIYFHLLLLYLAFFRLLF